MHPFRVTPPPALRLGVDLSAERGQRIRNILQVEVGMTGWAMQDLALMTVHGVSLSLLLISNLNLEIGHARMCLSSIK